MLLKKKKAPQINIKENDKYHQNITDNVNDIHSLFLPEAYMESNDNIYLGHERYLRVCAISVYPNNVNIGWLDEINSIGDIDISIHSQYVPNELMVKQLTRKSVQTMSEYQVYADRGDIYNMPVLREMIEDLEQERSDIQTNKDRMFYITILFNIHGKSLEDLQQKTLLLEDILSKRSVQIRTLITRQENGLISSLPLCSLDQNIRKDFDKNITTQGLATMFPISNPDLTHPSGMLLGKNYFSGSPMFFNPFIGPPVLNNPIIGIFGIPGSGKSVCIKTILNKSSALGTRIAVLDPEGEYKKSIEGLLGGNYITIKPGITTGINLFDIEIDYDNKNKPYVPIINKTAEIKALLSSIIRHSAKRPLSGVEQVAIEEAVKNTYNEFGITTKAESLYTEGGTVMEDGTYVIGKVKKKLPTFSDFYKQLVKYKSKIEELVTVLIPYLKGNSMGLFDCESTLPEDIRVIAFDLSQIEDEFTKFYSSFVLLSWLWPRFVQKYREDPKIIAVDETWQFINYPESAQFLERLARRGRKYRCALLFASQFLDEFLNNDAGKAVVNSCATNIFLRQNASAAELTVDYFKLASGAKNLLQTFSNGECIISMQGSVTACKIEPIPYEWPYITTN